MKKFPVPNFIERMNYQILNNMPPSKILMGLVSIVIMCKFVSPAFPQAWTVTSAPKADWLSVASSADGAKLVAITFPTGGIYASTNGGTNWILTSAPATNYSSIACSADGTKLIAVPFTGRALFLSTNCGTTWTTSNVPNAFWESVASSADGKKLVIVGSQGVLSSSDSGITWTNYGNPSSSWLLQVASSADGTRLITGRSGDPIYTSSDGGISWRTNNFHVDLLAGVASSADGTRLSVASFSIDLGGRIDISPDSGNTWTRSLAPTNCGQASIASSAQGRLLAAACTEVNISTDFGTDWIPVGAQSVWGRVVTMSADGAKLVVAAQGKDSTGIYDGSIYLRQSVPTPTLSIASSDNSLVLSWLVPSIPFVLQASPDLGAQNWAKVSPTPTLNYANLRYETTLPKPPATTFYRLALH